MTPEKSEGMSAPALAAAQLTKELGGPSGSSLANVAINDLSGMVKKKKSVPNPTPQTNDGSSSTTSKRKVEENAEDPPEKKLKIGEGKS